jgi:hypothetical protein
VINENFHADWLRLGDHNMHDNNLKWLVYINDQASHFSKYVTKKCVIFYFPTLTKPNYMGHIWTNYGIDMVQPMGHIWEVYGFGMAWLPS